MKVKEKTKRAKQAITFISTHDDAPLEHVEAALEELKEFIDSELKAAQERRAKKESEE